jgi:hypothetical protein
LIIAAGSDKSRLLMTIGIGHATAPRRIGDLAPLVGIFVRSTRIAAAESRITAQRLHEIPSQWRELTGPVRRGSAAAKILALLRGAPIPSSDDAVALIDAPQSSVFDAIGRLRDAGVLCALTARPPRLRHATRTTRCSPSTGIRSHRKPKDQPIYDMKKVATALDQLLECPDDQRIAVEGGLQRVAASVIVMQKLFSMA